MSSRSRDLLLGIDFGTSYSSAAVLIDGKVDFVVDDGDAAIPTVVHLPKRGEPLIGRPAARMLHANPSSTIVSIKRLLGRTVRDVEVARVNVGVGFRIAESPTGRVLVKLQTGDLACEQIAGYVLSRLRMLAERRFGGQAIGAVIGVPATCSGYYIEALRVACRLAQLELLQVVPEPVAGALAMGMHAEPGTRRIATCDFGGGTFDVSLLEQDGTRFTPVLSDGDDYLGGDDLDEAFAGGVAGAVFGRCRFDMQSDRVRWRELITRCESVKRILSSRREARLTMPDAYVEAGAHRDIDIMIDRTWIEARWATLVDRAVEVVGRSLARAGWKANEVDDLLMIGGTSLVPLVRRQLSACFPHKRIVQSEAANLAVATGCALQTAAFHGTKARRTARRVS
jgi:molecular chaperone DnaK